MTRNGLLAHVLLQAQHLGCSLCSPDAFQEPAQIAAASVKTWYLSLETIHPRDATAHGTDLC